MVQWGWYYLSTVLDDYSRYILAWQLGPTMQMTDVTATLDLARAKAGVDRVRVRHRPRLLSDNGPCYVSGALATYLAEHGLTHTRGAPYHPMTQGKIERYHRSLKNVVKLEHYWSPDALRRSSVNTSTKKLTSKPNTSSMCWLVNSRSLSMYRNCGGARRARG